MRRAQAYHILPEAAFDASISYIYKMYCCAKLKLAKRLPPPPPLPAPSVAFLFNWIGFCLSFCLTNTIAGRYGAICGFGLSLIKWILIVRVG